MLGSVSIHALAPRGGCAGRGGGGRGGGGRGGGGRGGGGRGGGGRGGGGRDGGGPVGSREERDFSARERDMAARERNMAARERDMAARERDLVARERDFAAGRFATELTSAMTPTLAPVQGGQGGQFIHGGLGLDEIGRGGRVGTARGGREP
jgi:hypothetical protein